MDYHKPPGMRWDPQAIKKTLRRRGIDARLIDGRVMFEMPSRERSRGIGTVSIGFKPSRFIANVQVRFESDDFTDDVVKCIDTVLTEVGFTPLTGDTEKTLAREYCEDIVAIEALESEIVRHQLAKESLVASQDFAAAARERDAQFAAMVRLDALIKKSTEERRLI